MQETAEATHATFSIEEAFKAKQPFHVFSDKSVSHSIGHAIDSFRQRKIFDLDVTVTISRFNVSHDAPHQRLSTIVEKPIWNGNWRYSNDLFSSRYNIMLPVGTYVIAVSISPVGGGRAYEFANVFSLRDGGVVNYVKVRN